MLSSVGPVPAVSPRQTAGVHTVQQHLIQVQIWLLYEPEPKGLLRMIRFLKKTWGFWKIPKFHESAVHFREVEFVPLICQYLLAMGAPQTHCQILSQADQLSVQLAYSHLALTQSPGECLVLPEVLRV